jgi:hypothetical protein
VKIDKTRPYYPPDYDEFVTASARALFEGKASEPQQKRIVEWLLFEVCGIRDLSYRPDSDRDTVFAEGKRFVGLQLVKMTKIPPGAVAEYEAKRRT